MAIQWVWRWIWASWQWQNFTRCFLFPCHQTMKKTHKCTPISYFITVFTPSWIWNWKETWQTSVHHLLTAPWLSLLLLESATKDTVQNDLQSRLMVIRKKELKMQWWSLTNQSTFWANTTASLQCTTNMPAIFWQRPFTAVIWIRTKIRVKQSLYSLTLFFF